MMDYLLSTLPGYSSFRMQLQSRRGPYCSFLLTIVLAILGFVIFIVQASKSNSAGTFFAFYNDKHMSSQHYYDNEISLPQAIVCPGNGVKSNNILDEIDSVECSFLTDGGESKTTMRTTRLDPVTMLMLDGTEERKVQCFSVDGSDAKCKSMFDIAKCDVFFDVRAEKEERSSWEIYKDLSDDQSRVFFLPNRYEFNNEDIDGSKKIKTDPKEMPLYWKRASPFHLTVFDVDLINVKTKHHKLGNNGVIDFYKGNYVEALPNEWANLTQYHQYFNNHPVLSFTYSYGEWFANDLKEVKVYPSSVMMGVVFGYAYMLTLLGLAVMFVAAWFFQFEWPIWSWNNTYIASEKIATEPPPQYYSSSFGQKEVGNTMPPSGASNGGYGAI